MRTLFRRLAILLLLLGALALAAGWFVGGRLVAWLSPQSTVVGGMRATGVPVVMRTPGGRLEVATVTTDEHFSRRDTRHLWGLSLGETVSEIRVPVTYRFHVELAREWVVTLEGTRATVRAPRLEPTVPVAFDTGAMQRSTRSGWARFDKDRNLAALERVVSAELSERARSPQALDLARDEARRTIAEFVTKWLLTAQRWSRDPDHSVVVLFPDEAPPRAGGGVAPQP